MSCSDGDDAPGGPSDRCVAEFRAVRDQPAGFTPHTVEGGDQRSECGPMDIRIRGDLDARVSDVEAALHVDTFHGGDVPAQATFLSVAMLRHLELPDGSRFRVGFNVAPGTYEGDGTYEITAEGIEVPGEAGNVRTPTGGNAFVEVVAPQGTDPAIVRFEELGRPCRLEVSSRGSRGDLRCPELRAADDRRVSLEWSWRTRPDPQGS